MSHIGFIAHVASTGPHGLLFHLVAALARHGYLILFGMVAAESFCSPLPGELSLGAAAYAASRGRLDLAAVACVAAAAAVSGDNLAYLVGRRAGRPLALRLAALLHVSERRVGRLDAAFGSHARLTVAGARWLSPVRGLVALSAGVTRLSWPRFASFNAVGSLTWAVTIAIVCYACSARLGAILHFLNVGGVVLAAGAVLGVAAVMWRRRCGTARGVG